MMESAVESTSMEAPSEQSLLRKQLINFYDSGVGGKDRRGRTFRQILDWNYDQLEAHHDFIQWVFPLTEVSAYQIEVPVLDEETLLVFRKSTYLQYQVLVMLQKMLLFYGFDSDFKYDEKNTTEPFDFTINPKNDPGSRSLYWRWLTTRNHNHQRITRIIRCLRLVRLGHIALEVFNAFIHINETYKKGQSESVSNISIAYWRRAAAMPLEDTPDHRKIEWLAKYNNL
ncbi:hypothetical protein F5Y18DRAFT_81316 [Xylariaceae sp. FL1019]|nr:hypothetical protein F5Y18DRAFT_81316 [Xylariaceae sp. FL1019]